MALQLKKASRDEKGNIINGSGLTLKEFEAIEEYRAEKENGKAAQSSNKGYENSGKTRDDYDAAVRSGNKKKAESESSAAYLPLPENNESGIPGEVELRNPNGAKPGPGVSSETLTVPVSKNKYYSFPDLYFTDEAKENEKSLDASKSGLSSAVNLRNAYDSAMSSVLTKIQEKSVLLTEYEKQLGTYKPIFDSADELTRKNNSLVEEYDRLAEQRNKELGALYDEIDRAYVLYEKTPTEELYSKYSASVNKYNSLLEQTQTELSGYEKQIGDIMAHYDATVGKTADYNKIFGEYSTLKAEYDKLVEEYDGYAAEFGDVLKNYDTKLAEYKAQSNKFASYYENEYKKWRATVRNSEIVKAEADALDKAIEELRKEISREFNPIEFIKKQANPNWSKPLKEKLAALESKRDITYEELSAAEAIEKAEYYASYTEREDFAEGSAYESTFGKEKEDAPYMTLVEMGNTLYGDLKYDYINGDEDAKLYAISLNEGLADPFEEYGYMEDDEILIYNYIYKTEGKEAAEAFLSDIMKDLNYRQMKTETEDYKAYADEHPRLGSLLSFLTNIMKPIAAIGQLGDYLLDGKIDTNASYNRASYLTSALLEGASADMNAVGKFLYQTGMSIANFVTVTALTGGSGASLAIMGMSSMADTTIEAKKRGLSDGKAIVLGAASGLIEAATEKIGLDKLMNIIAGGGKGVKGALKSILKQTLAEGGEELLSAVGNDVVDVLISLDKSKWETEIDALMEEDPSLTRNKAWGKVFGSHLLEYGLSGLGGMISGLVIGGLGVGIKALTGGFKKLDTSKMEKHEIKIPEPAKDEKNEIKYPEPYEIILDAKKAPIYSNYYKYAEQVAKSGELTSENILRLEELWEKRQHTPEAISQIEKLAGEGKTLDEVEKSVREKYDDETITYAEIEDAYNEAAEKQMAGTKATDKEYISMEDFANSESAVWHNVDYNDDASKSNIMQEVHDSMVSDGSVVKVSDSTLQNVGESYPDLRDLKKKERTPLLKEAMSKLKNNLRQFLGTFKNQSFDFEVNGKILEAKLYNTGINEVLEKITQEKANMLYTTEEIFKNARYLYSTTDYDGDPNVYRWNYFYTPVQIGEDIVGVRIAVRDLAKQGESQIYNWNIKKDTSLGGVQPVVSDSSHDASSDVSADTSLGGVRDDYENRKSHDVSSDVSADTSLDGGRRGQKVASSDVSSDVSDNSISQKADFDNTFSEKNNESADFENESAESRNENELDEPTENEITRRRREIEDEKTWRDPGDEARNKFYADEADFIRDLKAKGEYENHPIRKARTETARSGIVYGASESDIALAERLSKALGRDILFFSEEARNDNIKNGVWDRDTIWINVNHDPKKTAVWIIAHELTHSIEATKAYDALKKYVKSELRDAEFKRQCDDLLGMYSPSEVEFEVVSNYVADHLLTDEAAIMKLVRGNRTLAEKLLSILDKILEKIGIYGKRTEERLALERMRRIYLNALAEQANAAQSRDGMDSIGEGQKKKTDVDSLSGDEYLKELGDLLDSGEISEDEYDELYNEYVQSIGNSYHSKAKHSIVNLDDGRVYVEASRNVIKGKTLAEQRKDITQFFSDLLDEKNSLDIPTIEGDVLTITKNETASKARDNYKVVNGKRIKLTDDEFLVKLHIESHIDEIAEVSAKKTLKSDSKNHSFAKNGFTYRRAYFKDFDGKYYEVTLSIGNNGTVATVYNIGKIEEGVPPSAKIIAVVGSKPLGKTPSKNSISQINQKSNTSDKNNFPFSKNAKKSMSKKDVEAFAESARYLYEDATKDLKGKALENIERCERDFARKIGEIMKLPADFKRGTLHDIAKGIIAEQIKGGAVSSEIARELFEMMYEQGVVVDDDFYNQYKDLKKALRTTAVTLSGGYENDFGDWKAFKNATKGKLKIVKEGGLGVDSYYQELSEEYPELFPEDIVTIPEQLMRILKVAEEIKPTKMGLDEYFGETSASLKEWLWNDFNSAITEMTQQINFGKKYIEAVSQRMAQEGVVVPDAETLFETYKNLKKLRTASARAVANNALTPVEENYVRDLLTGRITLDQIPAEHYNVKAIQAVFEAKQPYENAMQVIKAYHDHRKSEQYVRADELLEGFENWKAPKAGLKLSANTMERNIYSMVKDTDRAEAIIKEYIAPIHSREAQSTRYKNKFLDKIRKLNISGKVTKGNRDSEASAVQFVGEAESHIMRLENNKRLKKSGGMTLAEWQKALSDFKIRNPELDYDRIGKCVKVFRKIYDQLLTDMNRARMLNGYEPIEYRYAYFPHFHRDIPTSRWGKFAERLGVQQDTATLPATIAGMTENFKPGIRWLSAAQERRMSETEYDCLEGFDRYISGAADVIFHTEDIQKLRSFANRIRYLASDDVIRAKIIAIEENTDLTDEEKHKRISEIAESRFTLSAFVNELDEYTNLLAGKKLRADRQSEQDMERTFYNWSKWFKSRFGANMIAGNLGSAMTNFIPIAQAAGITRHQMLKAMYQQIKSGFADDGFADRSDFLTNRILGTDKLSKTTSDKISDVLGTPMELIDGFSSGTIVRALYNQAKHDGLSDAEAMERANTRAAEIMADRSKGAMPTVFSRANFLTAIFTQFQLEVANQYGYMMKDLPRYYSGDKRKWLKVIGALLKIFILSYIFNDLYEALVGRRAAFDPIDIVNDAIGDATGYKLPNMVDALWDVVFEDESVGDVFKTDKKGKAKSFKNFGINVREELPFVGGIWGGGRIPISSAMPDVGKLYDTFTTNKISRKKKMETLVNELDSLFYVIPPYGGGQLRKMLDAIPSIAQGGSYTYDNDGNRQLQYPTQTGGTVSDIFEAGRSLTFGKSSSRYAREWVESGFDTFSVNETDAYEEILDKGFSKKVAFDAIRDYEKAKGSLSRKVDKIDALLSIGTDEDINYVIYKRLIASDSEASKLDGRLEEFEAHGLGFVDYLDVISTDSDFYSGKKKQATFWEMVDGGTSAKDAISSLVGESEAKKTDDAGNAGAEAEEDQSNFTESEMKTISALSESGFSSEESESIVDGFRKITPTNGRKKAGQYQKAESIVNSVSSPEKQLEALSAVMSNKQYQIMKLAYETYSIEPSLYIKVYLAAEKLSYETTGKTDVNKTELKTVLDDLNLNDGKKAQLYQFITSEDVTMNPYSFEHANYVKEDMDALFA